MEIPVNESSNDNRNKTNVESLVAFIMVNVVAIFLLISSMKQPDSPSILQQKYFWNIQMQRNFVYTLLANGFLYTILLIFRKIPNTLIWCVFTFPLMLMSLMIAVWLFMIFENVTYHEQPLWIPVVLFTVIATAFGMLMYKYRGNVNLVTEIIGESLRALDGVRSFVLIPVVNSLILLFPMNVFYSAYELIKDENFSFRIIWITTAFILFFFFMNEFQKFMISGVTTKCYFTRDKNNLGRPIVETLTVLLKFHIGSVCYGAMIKFFRPSFGFVSHFLKTFNLTNNTKIINITNWFDAHTESNDAYVLIYKDGTPYYESVQKLYFLQSKDPINANRIKNTKNSTIFIVKFFFWAVIATIQALIIENDGSFLSWIESNIEVFITLVYIFCMVSIYINYIETITDTTIINACIDFETNDGNMKPYYMSKSMGDFIKRLRNEDQAQLIISQPEILEVPQTVPIYTLNHQRSQNIVYILPDLSNQVRDELIPTQNYQPSAPQLD